MLLPDSAGGDEAKLYLRGSPASADYLLDAVRLRDNTNTLVLDGGFECGGQDWGRQGCR